MPRSEEDFLREINADLPAGVDWKQGAITYLRELVRDGGDVQHHFHLLKPFLGGPDFEPFWVDVFGFLDVVRAADLGQRSRILDVGCGPGWTVHWLAKLGHDVVGIDISDELLAVAAERMAADPFPPFAGRPFDYTLQNHDIEAAPLGLDRPVDLALFESTLHHFHNPVAALRNVASDLAPMGLLAIIEAAAPPVGSVWHTKNVELMERYHTIERPYTREQLYDLLELAGFGYARVFRPVNDLVPQTADGLNRIQAEVAVADNVNVVLAATNATALERVAAGVVPLARWRTGFEAVAGFFHAETRPDGSCFRWCGPRGSVRCTGPGPVRLDVATVGLPQGAEQAVYLLVDGAVVARTELTAEAPATHLVVPAGAPGRIVELHSDRVFSPAWGGDGDTRVLSFTLDMV